MRIVPARGQILVTTILLLMLIALTVLSITSIASKNALQVVSNVDYQHSYNYAESKILQIVKDISKPELKLTDISGVLSTAAGIDQCDTSDKVVCSFTEVDNDRRTIVQVEEVNYVENYELGKEEYFSIALLNKTDDYRGIINLSWLGSTALELKLTYRNPSQELEIAEQIIDPSTVYNSAPLASGFLTENPIPDSRVPEAKIDLSKLNSARVPLGAKLIKLDIKAINNQGSGSITFRPDVADTLDFPNQIRRIQAFNYSKTKGSTSVPVVVTQIPLNPQMPSVLGYALNFAAIHTPMCGNGVIEGSEMCDDGNLNDTDNCSNDCVPSICKYNNDASGLNTDFVQRWDVSTMRKRYLFFKMLTYWEKDYIHVVAGKSDGTEINLVPPGCYGNGIFLYDPDPTPNTSFFGFDWFGDKVTPNPSEKDPYCTIYSHEYRDAWTLVQPDWEYVEFRIKNGQVHCGAPNTKWKIEISCPDVKKDIRNVTDIAYQWSGCTGGCGSDGCDV